MSEWLEHKLFDNEPEKTDGPTTTADGSNQPTEQPRDNEIFSSLQFRGTALDGRRSKTRSATVRNNCEWKSTSLGVCVCVVGFGLLGACWYTFALVLQDRGAVTVGAVREVACTLVAIEARPSWVVSAELCGGPPCCAGGDCALQCARELRKEECTSACEAAATSYLASALLLLERRAGEKGSPIFFDCASNPGNLTWDCWPWQCPIQAHTTMQECEQECIADARCRGFGFSQEGGGRCFFSAVGTGEELGATVWAGGAGGQRLKAASDVTCVKKLQEREAMVRGAVAARCWQDLPRSTSERRLCQAQKRDTSEVATVISEEAEHTCLETAEWTLQWSLWLVLPALVMCSIPAVVWLVVACFACVSRCTRVDSDAMQNLHKEEQRDKSERAVYSVLPCCALCGCTGAAVTLLYFVVVPWALRSPAECSWLAQASYQAAQDKALQLLEPG